MIPNEPKIYTRHYEAREFISAKATEVFAYIDDHANFSSHMKESSWVMGGGHMDVSIDGGRGQKVGSHIKLSGKIFGITLFLDEIITHRESPNVKEWETVNSPKLLVIGNYKMKVEVEPQKEGSLLWVSIDYDLPSANAWIGKLFGAAYAKWCVEQMIKGVRTKFSVQKT